MHANREEEKGDGSISPEYNIVGEGEEIQILPPGWVADEKEEERGRERAGEIIRTVGGWTHSFLLFLSSPKNPFCTIAAASAAAAALLVFPLAPILRPTASEVLTQVSSPSSPPV